jgi:tellurite resistance protein TehA-like permease
MRYARIAHLAPGYFALVMAMGILSVAAADEGLPGISAAWLWVAVAAYAVLVGLNVARIARFRSSVAEDLANPSRSFEFFAFVAATCVLGTRSAVGRTLAPALALWLMGLVGWVCLWVVLPRMARARVDLRRHPEGGWLLAVVATQSVALLGALLVVSLCLWVIGIAVYLVLLGLVAARVLRFDFRPRDLRPGYWITMGALAITTVAGAGLARASAVVLGTARPLERGVATAAWIGASALIPLLVAAEMWRLMKEPTAPGYEPAAWTRVFPLGMYAVATHAVAVMDGLRALRPVGLAFLWVGTAAWAITAGALVRWMVRGSYPPRERRRRKSRLVLGGTSRMR